MILNDLLSHKPSALIPISRFDQGEATEVFAEVKTNGFGVVVKNDVPECVLISPERYQEMEEIMENYYLLQLADRYYSQPTIPQEEVLSSLGINLDDIRSIEVEIE